MTQETSQQKLLLEIDQLRAQLAESQEVLRAIQHGEVDALVVSTPKGNEVYTLTGAEKSYRILVEQMKEGAVMLGEEGTILYANSGFAKIVAAPLDKLVGACIRDFVTSTQTAEFEELLMQGKTGEGGMATQISLKTAEGKTIPTHISANTLKVDSQRTTFLVVTDLTEHMEEEVKRYTTQLEQAQTQIYESEQRWATTLGSIGDAVIATDLTGKITFMNVVAQQLTAWSMHDAIGKQVQEIFRIVNEKTRQTVENPVSKVMVKGKIVGLANHTILITKDGQEVPIDDSGAPIKDKQGKMTGVVLIFRDIGQRRKAERAVLEQKERAETYLNVAGNIILALDTEGKVTLLNKAGYNILGYPEGALQGKDWFEAALPAQTRAKYRGLFEEWMKTGYVGQFENQIITKDGKIREINWHNSKIVDAQGRAIGILRSGEDITERKQMQAKLEEYTKNLEELVEQRTKSLKSAERLAAIGATAGMVGHDIRNPLQAITGDLYLAREGLKEIPDTEKRKAVEESLDSIEENIYYINKIVSDLQDYTRPLKSSPQKVKARDLLNNVVTATKIPAKVQTQVIADESLGIYVDAAYIRRAFTNLITNAVQAMPGGGKITITAQTNSDSAVITVTDTGVGIPDAVRQNLFTPLFTTKSKGQGLGLAVVKRLIDAMGGTITFDSKVGEGTTFTVTLPQTSQKTAIQSF